MLTKEPAAVLESERAWPLYRDAMLAMGVESRDEKTRRLKNFSAAMRSRATLVGKVRKSF